VKKTILLIAALCLCSAQMLVAQINGSPNVICPPQNTRTGSLQPLTCPPNPTPTPIPTPSPTPSPTPAVGGFIGPKFVVLTVTYAPPGSRSTVTYTNSNMLGTSLSLTNSFTNDVSVSTSVTAGFSIFGLGATTTSTNSADLTQESDSSSSIALNEASTKSTIIPGPASSAVGLDHDEDIIWVWLNPVIHFVVNSSTSFTWTGFGFDLNDPANNTDILGIPVKFLNGHAPMPADIADVLARRWAPPIACDPTTDTECGADGTKGPGLTAADLATILSADPFSNPAYVINIPSGSPCTADGRFCLTTNQNLQYSPPPPGGQPITQTFSVTHQTTATQGQGAQTTYKVGFSRDFTAGTDPKFLPTFSAKLSVADTLSWMSKWSSLSTQQVGETASLSVTGPAVADNYTGPVEFNVFQDSLYGTFMFGFIPEPTFTLSASPAAQSVNQGSCTNYTVSTAALVSGFSATINLAVTGLGNGATGSFNPSTISGAGSSTLTVCTTSSTPIGTSSLTINATAGIEIHSTSVSLTVNTPPPPPNFTLAVSPSSQSVTQGNGASYTVSTAAVNGFTGIESLALSGLPAGASASFSPASIATGGTSTLSVSTASTTPVGTYSLVITGTSGTLSHTATASLVVTNPVIVPPPPKPCIGRNCPPQ